jgi:hypothetical protein
MVPERMSGMASYTDRFWEKVDRSGECWEWTAYCNEWGYVA